MTSVDLELDYQASLTKVEMMKDDLNRLKKIEKDIEHVKANGGELPTWFLENECLQTALTESVCMSMMKMVVTLEWFEII